VNHR